MPFREQLHLGPTWSLLKSPFGNVVLINVVEIRVNEKIL